ncbi:flagellar basal body P-ring formation chaperone FlgA [Desulfovibrio sp. OttesenSCG-928-G11]|nr:flagellar basal body P-ring formation chaperone FlgA [Desulfovibrio sp. OttesenSCG-928-G11]
MADGRICKGLLFLFFMLAAPWALAAPDSYAAPGSEQAAYAEPGYDARKSGPGGEKPWRIRFLEAAVVEGDKVRLGEVAVPLGDMPAGLWDTLAQREIWPAPLEGGRPVNMTRPRLQEAVVHSLRDLAPYCLFPGSLIVQRGGSLIGKEAVRLLVEREMAPYLASLPGETGLTDFRLPQQVFLAHAGQRLSLEPLKKVAPGRLSLRLHVQELDGTVKQKLSGTVFVDCWAEVPVAATALGKDNTLDPAAITFKRLNLASLRGEAWDGRGGPWRLVRPLAPGQVIYQQDVAHIPTVRKGVMVTLMYEGKNVRLTVPVEAMADGVTGENIPVRNKQSRKEIYATVRDSSTVIVAGMP